jgi:hypothetical protein
MDYNGWTNYETCVVYECLMGGTQEVPEPISALAREAENEVAFEAALKQYVTATFLPTLGPGLGHDLLKAAVERVNWHELAQRYWHGRKQAATE